MCLCVYVCVIIRLHIYTTPGGEGEPLLSHAITNIDAVSMVQDSVHTRYFSSLALDYSYRCSLMSSMHFTLLLTSFHIKLGGPVMHRDCCWDFSKVQWRYMEIFVIYSYLETTVSKCKQLCALCILE